MRGYIGVGIGLLYCALIVVMIAAKVAGHIAWAWWIVLSPLWGPVALAIVLALIAIVCFAGAESRGENPFQ
jgi:hypothetical protein